MKRIWLFCVLGIFLTACTFKVKEYPVIKDPINEKPVSLTESPGYSISYSQYLVKVLNGLPHLVKISVGPDASLCHLIKPGGQFNIPFLKSHRSRIVVMTAVILDGKEIVGTASEPIVVPRYGSVFEERVWHIISYQKIN